LALNALPINIGRAIGPALGGILVAASGRRSFFRASTPRRSSRCS